MADQSDPPRQWMPAFLAALRNSGNVRASCQAAKISRKEAYKQRDRSATFRAAWDEALADAIDILEAEAWRRARDMSDTLLIFLLKAHRRELYGDRVQLDIPALVDRYAAAHGLDEADKARAVAESERLLKELRGAGR